MDTDIFIDIEAVLGISENTIYHIFFTCKIKNEFNNFFLISHVKHTRSFITYNNSSMYIALIINFVLYISDTLLIKRS